MIIVRRAKGETNGWRSACSIGIRDYGGYRYERIAFDRPIPALVYLSAE